MYRGNYYFPSLIEAREFAERNGFPTNRILEYGRGWAIQLRVSGPYVGPETPRMNPSPRHADEIEAAAKLQADFSGHEPGNVDRVKVGKSKVFTPVGKLTGVLYDTVRDGQPEKYIHRFRRKSRPLLASNHDGTELRIVGGRFRVTEAGIVDE